ncbi:hypothetical protein N7510_008492 [Penicillium lagena]|uniref:uncharacterized protein n=1 Tax=Penicillium lagena TaxID=94218 RepID=UPI00253FD632|nr:uncharacterized protein N7510_008492 [Penicillium lagena]KAJ5605711.1 hypothetical protein N7510_008492 [Penicillium lagena]
MNRHKKKESATIFQNIQNTVFLIDIPTSIALAQNWTPAQGQDPPEPKDSAESSTESHQKTKCLISSPPLRAPYPSSTEPKTDAARAKLLQRFSGEERRFHEEIVQPLVRDALDEIRGALKSSSGREWCLPRCVLDENEKDSKREREPQKWELSKDSGSGSGSRKRKRGYGNSSEPPIVLSSSSSNTFESMADLQGIVKNPSSSESAILTVAGLGSGSQTAEASTYIVPPTSSFVLCTLPLSDPGISTPIPGLPEDHRFNLMLLDPPWPNRSVRRSGHYNTHPYFGMEELTQCLGAILRAHSYVHDDVSCTNTVPDHHPSSAAQSRQSLAAIWVTNSERSRKAAYDSLRSAGFRVCEEWIWIKITTDGQPISTLDGLWRRPYETLIIGRKPTGNEVEDIVNTTITRRVIAAVPDLHSRKPNLKSIFEEVFFASDSSDRYNPIIVPYAALEVFARNLTAGWWACGNEAIKFNASQCWTDIPTHFPNAVNPTLD